MYSSISPPQLSPCFIPQPFSFGFNNDMNFTSPMPMSHHYFTAPLSSPTRRSTTSHKLMLSPKSTPTKIHQPNEQLVNEPMRKQSSQKKDRNGKIVTAQGLRDRRVRLSVDIARRFFDLQDLLGFDTASKTLDWLLTKSRTAIKELQTNPVVVVEENAKQCEAYVTFTGADEESNKNKSTFCTTKRRVESGHQVEIMEIKEERFAQNYCVKSFDNNFGKEARAKARAGAPHESEPFGLLQPIKSCKTCESELFCFCQLNGIAESEETFGNLGVITKKLKPSTVTSDNLEMNSGNTLFCSNNIINSSGDLYEIFGGIQQ